MTELQVIYQKPFSSAMALLCTVCSLSAPCGSRLAFSASHPLLSVPPLRPARMPLRQRRQDVVAAASEAATPSPGNGDVVGEMLEPSTANKPVVRFLALAGAVALAARSAGFLPSTAVRFVHMLAFGTWFGTLAWTSFIFGIVAFRNLPRQTFGRLQSKLFPKYFALSAAAPAIMLATLNYATGGAPPVKEMYLLGISLVGSVLNLLWTEPAATRVMFQRYDLENAKGPRDEGERLVLRNCAECSWHSVHVNEQAPVN